MVEIVHSSTNKINEGELLDLLAEILIEIEAEEE